MPIKFTIPDSGLKGPWVINKFMGGFLARILPLIVNNADKISDYGQWFEIVLRHEEMNRRALVDMTFSIANNADKILDYGYWFERILGHERVDSSFLDEMLSAIVNNIDKIPDYRHWFDVILRQ